MPNSLAKTIPRTLSIAPARREYIIERFSAAAISITGALFLNARENRDTHTSSHAYEDFFRYLYQEIPPITPSSQIATHYRHCYQPQHLAKQYTENRYTPKELKAALEEDIKRFLVIPTHSNSFEQLYNDTTHKLTQAQDQRKRALQKGSIGATVAYHITGGHVCNNEEIQKYEATIQELSLLQKKYASILKTNKDIEQQNTNISMRLHQIIDNYQFNTN